MDFGLHICFGNFADRIWDIVKLKRADFLACSLHILLGNRGNCDSMAGSLPRRGNSIQYHLAPCKSIFARFYNCLSRHTNAFQVYA